MSAINSRIDPETQATEIDLGAWSSFFAYDVISRLCFGEEFGFAKEGRDRWELVDGFRRGWYSQGLYARMPGWYRFVQAMPASMRWIFDSSLDNPEGMGRVTRQRDRLIEERLRARENMAEYKPRGDILDQ